MKQPREYQKRIFESILKNGNTLVVLPTGMGKTLIGLMLIKYMIENKHKGICLFLSPTKPLVKQHVQTIKNELGVGVGEASGDIGVEKRKDMYKNKPVIVATPQTIKNDVERGILNLEDVKLLIIDEAHRTTGKYAYTYICKNTNNALIVGLTASPGGTKKRIEEIARNLNIKNIETRTTNDEDVKRYVHGIKIRTITVELPPVYVAISNKLREIINEYGTRLKKIVGIPPPVKRKAELIKYRERINEMQTGAKYRAIVLYGVLLNANHMLELLETQGIWPVKVYLEKLGEKDSKTSITLMKDPRIREIKEYINAVKDYPHPKVGKLVQIIKSKITRGKRGIIFVQYRDQIEYIIEKLKENGVKAVRFVGKRKGSTKKEQEKTIEMFRNNEIDVLVSTSIGEEGLDIPAVDVVVFYEPIPSEIRSIQRKGRTGRFGEGEVIILITKKTRDEWYYWAAVRKEKQMYKTLYRMKKSKAHIKREKNKEERSKNNEDKDDKKANKIKQNTKQKGKEQSRIVDYM